MCGCVLLLFSCLVATGSSCTAAINESCEKMKKKKKQRCGTIIIAIMIINRRCSSSCFIVATKTTSREEGNVKERSDRRGRERRKKKKTAWLNITETRGIQQPTAITVIVIRAYHSRHLLLVNKAKRTENA